MSCKSCGGHLRQFGYCERFGKIFVCESCGIMETDKKTPPKKREDIVQLIYSISEVASVTSLRCEVDWEQNFFWVNGTKFKFSWLQNRKDEGRSAESIFIMMVEYSKHHIESVIRSLVNQRNGLGLECQNDTSNKLKIIPLAPSQVHVTTDASWQPEGANTKVEAQFFKTEFVPEAPQEDNPSCQKCGDEMKPETGFVEGFSCPSCKNIRGHEILKENNDDKIHIDKIYGGGPLDMEKLYKRIDKKKEEGAEKILSEIEEEVSRDMEELGIPHPQDEKPPFYQVVLFSEACFICRKLQLTVRFDGDMVSTTVQQHKSFEGKSWTREITCFSPNLKDLVNHMLREGHIEENNGVFSLDVKDISN